MNKDKTCHVYLLAHKDPAGIFKGPVKIGITHSLSSRVKTLQTGNPAPIGLVFAFSTPDMGFAKIFEQALHVHNADTRLAGEWFDMNPRAALLCMVSAFWGILSVEIGSDRELMGDAMEACGAVRAMELLGETDGDLVH